MRLVIAHAFHKLSGQNDLHGCYVCRTIIAIGESIKHEADLHLRVKSRTSTRAAEMCQATQTTGMCSSLLQWALASDVGGLAGEAHNTTGLFWLVRLV